MADEEKTDWTGIAANLRKDETVLALALRNITIVSPLSASDLPKVQIIAALSTAHSAKISALAEAERMVSGIDRIRAHHARTPLPLNIDPSLKKITLPGPYIYVPVTDDSEATP